MILTPKKAIVTPNKNALVPNQGVLASKQNWYWATYRKGEAFASVF
jgi:hypothetical protein